jgi:Zn-dependent protease with chaperone function
MADMEVAIDSKTKWQADADRFAKKYKWLPFWRPIIVVKRGGWSPCFLPQLWFAKKGAYASFLWIVISDELLECDKTRRHAIVSHECCHVFEFHDFIRWFPLFLFFHTSLINNGFHWIATKFGGLPSAIASVIAIFAILTLFLKLYYWFEYRADDYAISKVGLATMIETLSWLNETSPKGKNSRWVEKRIQRLIKLNKFKKID